MKTKAFLVVVNTQLDAAPLNSHALGKLINKVIKLDQLNMEIGKIARGGPAPYRGLSYTHAYPIAITWHYYRILPLAILSPLLRE
jgi:hypothetical protein